MPTGLRQPQEVNILRTAQRLTSRAMLPVGDFVSPKSPEAHLWTATAAHRLRWGVW